MFNIPIGQSVAETTALNQFLRQNRIVQSRKELVILPDGAFWTFLVEYLPGAKEGERIPGKTGVDYRDLLSAEDFSWFIKLKELRTAWAEKAGLPVYAVLTNEQLAEIATKKPATLVKLKEIKGIGDAKTLAYGQAILDCFVPATSGSLP